MLGSDASDTKIAKIGTTSCSFPLVTTPYFHHHTPLQEHIYLELQESPQSVQFLNVMALTEYHISMAVAIKGMRSVDGHTTRPYDGWAQDLAVTGGVTTKGDSIQAKACKAARVR
jgi:hypothetical protein